MASPLRSAILRGLEAQEPQKEKAAPPPPKPGLGALARAIGRGKEVKKVTIVGGGGAAGQPGKKSGPRHGDPYPYDATRVWDAVKGKWVSRASLGEGPDKPVYEKK